MTKMIAAIVGMLLIFLGILGFAYSDFCGLHLSPTNNVLCLTCGLLALLSGTIGSALAARTFCGYVGLLYGVLGLAGLFGRGPDRLLTLIPNHLVFGTMDHVAHLVLAGTLLLAGLYGRYEESLLRGHAPRLHKSAHNL